MKSWSNTKKKQVREFAEDWSPCELIAYQKLRRRKVKISQDGFGFPASDGVNMVLKEEYAPVGHVVLPHSDVPETWFNPCHDDWMPFCNPVTGIET